MDKLLKNKDKRKENTLSVSIDIVERHKPICQYPVNSNKHQIDNNIATKFSPRPHQLKAIQDVILGFQQADRGQLIMACATGKTLTSLWIAEKMKPKRLLVLFPTLDLLRQTKREWGRHGIQSRQYLCVCSEKQPSVISNIAHGRSHSITTNDPIIIREFLKSTTLTTIFATYQSLTKIISALENTSIEFDLVICDEAHKTAGIGNSSFKQVHNNILLPAKKRLYMTATPKILRVNTSSQNYHSLVSVASMENPETFGQVFHNLTQVEAKEQGILIDCAIVVVGVLKEEISQFLSNHSIDSLKPNSNELINNYALHKFMNERDAKNVITFHHNIAKAKVFQQNHQMLFPELKCFHINGNQPSAVRQLNLNSFASADTAVITNARCLNEGIDIPKTSAVFFSDTRNSQVDVVQAMGRAMRRSDDHNKKIGYIVLPTLHVKGKNLNEEIARSNYKKMLDIICALNNADNSFISNLANELQTYRKKLDNQMENEDHQPSFIQILSNDRDFSKYLYTELYQTIASIKPSLRDLLTDLESKGINSYKLYQEAYHNGNLLLGSPEKPYQNYSNCPKWLSIRAQHPVITYKALQAFCQAHPQINSQADYVRAYRNGILPDGSPYDPKKFFKKTGEWKGWHDFLGKKKFVLISYKKLQAFCQAHPKINSKTDYQRAYRKGILPDGSPYNPRSSYPNFPGWYVFLGKEPPKKKQS